MRSPPSVTKHKIVPTRFGLDTMVGLHSGVFVPPPTKRVARSTGCGRRPVALARDEIRRPVALAGGPRAAGLDDGADRRLAPMDAKHRPQLDS